MYFSEFYSLNDPVEIKLAVLYALAKIDAPIRLGDLVQILVESTNVNYFELKVQIDELIATSDIIQKEENKQVNLRISTDGHESVKYLGHKLPYSVKSRISESISSFYVRKKFENEITADIVPVNVDEFLVSCKVEYGNIPMMNLQMYAGSREYAEKLVAHFKRHASEIYTDIMDDFVKNRDIDKNKKDTKKENR